LHLILKCLSKTYETVKSNLNLDSRRTSKSKKNETEKEKRIKCHVSYFDMYKTYFEERFA